jgi:hypothetical protein
VTIFGLVASQGPAHINPAPLCTPPVRPGKPVNSTACVEVWSGTTVLIDSTGTHKGEISADTATSGGISGHGWIDILANGDITINDGTGDDPGILDGFLTDHAVHANQYLGNGRGGDIQVLSKAGKVSTFGNAIQANDTFNGAHGGTVKVQAGGAGSPAGDVLFGTASIQAKGSTGGSLISRGGGTISGRSFNGDLSGFAGGELNAAGGPPLGSVTLEACLFATYLGTSTPPFVLGANDGTCGGSPTFPALTPPEAYPLAICLQLCGPVTNTPTPTVTRTAELPTVTPTPGGFCNKAPVLEVLNGRVPDVIVRTDLGQSIQAAVDNATDTNGDGYIIVGVVNNGSGTLGGHVSQRVTVSQVYPKPFLLFGCSVTLHDPNKADGLPTGLITAGAGSPGNIFVMDLHGADSEVAGWKVEGDGRTLRNVGTSGSAVGVWLAGNNNTMHNGAGSSNTGVGILVSGNGNTVDSSDAFANGSHGVQVTGNTNSILKVDTGEIGKGNGGDGVNVSGTGTTLTEITSRSNGGNGFKVTSSGNSLKKNDAGGTPSQNNTGCEYDVAAGNTNLGENKANGVTVVGNPFPTGCIN